MQVHDDLPNAYWVTPGRLLAGPYPSHADATRAEPRVAALLALGVDYVVDLTEPGEYGLRPYWPLLSGQAAARGCTISRQQYAIRDLATPSVTQMSTILDDVDRALQAGCIVYIHCFGGIGRTGTVVGCHLVRHGMSGAAALEAIQHLRALLPKGARPSPETAAQREMVRTWHG